MEEYISARILISYTKEPW